MKPINGFPITKINDLDFTEDKKYIYFVGDSNIVYRMVQTSWEIEQVVTINDAK